MHISFYFFFVQLQNGISIVRTMFADVVLIVPILLQFNFSTARIYKLTTSDESNDIANAFSLKLSQTLCPNIVLDYFGEMTNEISLNLFICSPTEVKNLREYIRPIDYTVIILQTDSTEEITNFIINFSENQVSITRLLVVHRSQLISPVKMKISIENVNFIIQTVVNRSYLVNMSKSDLILLCHVLTPLQMILLVKGQIIFVGRDGAVAAEIVAHLNATGIYYSDIILRETSAATWFYGNSTFNKKWMLHLYHTDIYRNTPAASLTYK